MNFSSVFEAGVFSAVPSRPGVVLDLCAAPGGKSVMAWRMLSPRLLVSNEVIRKRTAQLVANLGRCRVGPAVVTSLDSAVMAERAADVADVVIVDAPCSGQSLMAKGKQVSAPFHSHVINHNRNRQRRILSNAARLVKPGGFLAYITCTYSLKENEGNVGWFLERHEEFEGVEVPSLSGFRSHLADFPCYRMWPDEGLGSGGFTSLLCRRAVESEGPGPWDPGCLQPVWQSPLEKERTSD
jgi:16S rRNA C967 or C1407 C5-methylase (RsmB/RsmF family)